MFGLSPLFAAIVAALAAFATSTWWFGVMRRRIAETTAGIQALAGSDRASLQPGDVFGLETPGGGGWGAPAG